MHAAYQHLQILSSDGSICTKVQAQTPLFSRSDPEMEMCKVEVFIRENSSSIAVVVVSVGIIIHIMVVVVVAAAAAAVVTSLLP